MTQPRWNRWCVLLVGFVVSAALLGISRGSAADEKPRVRQSIQEFVKDEKKLAALRKAIQVMQDLEPTHPFSWAFQANIHGRMKIPEFLLKQANDPKASADLRLFRDDPDFNPQHDVFKQCPHGNWWFFPWHRAYLYYFERILQWAAEDQTLSLPYWNYSDPNQRTLPDVFQQKTLAGGKRNSLYLPPGIEVKDDKDKDWLFPLRSDPFDNGNTALTERATKLDALKIMTFHRVGGTSTDTFGGAVTEKLTESGQAGALEIVPHGLIHDAVGGDSAVIAGEIYAGFMAYVPSAARDPIFWLHHANVDRLWDVWIKMGGKNPDDRKNPLDKKWLDMAFKFYDVGKDGKPVAVTITVEELLKKDLGCVYDDTNPPWKPTAPPGPFADKALAKLTFEPLALSRSPDAVIPLSNKSKTTLPIKMMEKDDLAKVPAVAKARGEEKGRLVLAIEGISRKARKPGDLYYEVYLNLPEGAAADPKSPHFVGTLSFFGLSRHAVGKHADELPEVKLNVTSAVRGLLDTDKFDADKLSVTFIPRTATEPKKGIDLPAIREQNAAVVRQVRLLHAR